MKTIKMLMMVVFTLFSFSLFAQSNSMEKPGSTKNKIEKKEYSCPMKCEGDKTYDKPGQCPKCGMDLKENKSAAVAYSCPMKCEGDKTYDKPGQCPTCGMDLKEIKTAAVAFSCPMKCEGDKTYDKAGKCPKCGMNLKAVKKDAVKKDDHSGHGH